MRRMSYLTYLPFDLQKEVIKKRYLDVLRELESVTRELRNAVNDRMLDYIDFDSNVGGIRIRVRVTNSIVTRLTIPTRSVFEKYNGNQIEDVYWHVGYTHSNYSFQTLSKLIAKKEINK
jgi:hypothetical protein